MELSELKKHVRDSLARFQPRGDFILILLSFISLGLTMANQFIRPDHMPVWSLHWADISIWLRTLIWAVFVLYFGVYGLFSANRLEYARTHILELIIVMMWLPFGSGAFIANLGQGLLTGDMLQIVGTLAHGWRVVRWTARRFSAHPIYVTGSAAILLIASAAALLNHFEPQTFPSFWDAAWYGLSTITTIGYGDFVPKTAIGRGIATVLIVMGISLAGVFIAAVSESVRARLLKGNGLSTADLKTLKAQLDENHKLQQQVLEETRADRALQQQILQELQALRSEREKDKPTSPEA